MSRVLVTGGAGFIGSELCRQLTDHGANVIVVDNLVNGKRENLADLPTGACSLIVGDIRDRSLMAKTLAGVDVVFHLACLGVRHSIHSPHENHEVNAGATLSMLSLARAAGVRRFVYVSSSEVYGTAVTTPIDENHRTFPETVYGASKLAGECYARAFYRTYGYPTIVIRPFNAYGPRCHHEGDSGEAIPRFMLRCMTGRPMVIFGDGTQTRDFTYVGDIAAGICAAGSAEGVLGETVNLGSGMEMTINALTAEVKRVVGNTEGSVIYDAARPGDVLRLLAGTSKAERLLAFRPRVGLGAGLAKLKAWYEASGKSPETLVEQEVLHNWKR